ncbi:MAG: hypothetical protein KBS77_03525 [Bacteroidales bacterium]|nr:hypothetical protein [Candidatus Colicola faecequi]
MTVSVPASFTTATELTRVVITCDDSDGATLTASARFGAAVGAVSSSSRNGGTSGPRM